MKMAPKVQKQPEDLHIQSGVFDVSNRPKVPRFEELHITSGVFDLNDPKVYEAKELEISSEVAGMGNHPRQIGQSPLNLIAQNANEPSKEDSEDPDQITGV